MEDIRNKAAVEKEGQKVSFYSRSRTTARMGRASSGKLSGSLNPRGGHSQSLRKKEKTGNLFPKTALLNEPVTLEKENGNETTVLHIEPESKPSKKAVSVEVVEDIRICDTEEIIE